MLALNPVMYHLVSGVGWRNALRIMGSSLLLVGFVGSSSSSPPKRLNKEDSDFKDNPESNHNDYSKVRLEDTEDAQPMAKRETNNEHNSKIHLEIFRFPEFWIMIFAIVICEMSLSIVLFYWVSLTC